MPAARSKWRRSGVVSHANHSSPMKIESNSSRCHGCKKCLSNPPLKKMLRFCTRNISKTARKCPSLHASKLLSCTIHPGLIGNSRNTPSEKGTLHHPHFFGQPRLVIVQ